MDNIGILCLIKLVLFACVPYGSGLSVPLTENFIQASSTVAFEHKYGDRSKRTVDQLPEGSIIRITLDGSNVQLDLERNYNLDVHIPMFVQRDGHIEQVQYYKTQKSALYQDRKSGGAFLMEPPTSSSSNSKIFGTFHHNSSHFLIQPVEDDLDPQSEGHEKGHVVSRIPETELVFDSIQAKGARDYLGGKVLNRRAGGRSRRQTNTYSIELLAVVDYEKYQFWYGRSAGSGDRSAETMRLIREYMVFMMNAIDVRYKSISSINFNIMSAGVYVADTASASPFTSDKVANGVVDGSAVLEAFTNWLGDQTGLPQYDHAMAFTRHDVSSSTGDSAGIAFVASLCTAQSTSLVEDSLNFVTMATAAHELGHSLGGEHDGAGNTCSSADNFIMAPSNRISGDSQLGQRLWLFSSCSVNYFNSYINRLNSQNRNCMLRTHPNADVPATTRPMAEVFPADELCANNIGTGSVVCRSIQNYNNMCTGMYCSKPGTSTCYSIIPAEGTPCGKGKWCERGRCVTSPNAPNDVTDTCPLGDRPGIYQDGLTCPQYVSRNLNHCYGSSTEANCCESCNRERLGIPNCPYGDRASGCQRSQCPWYSDGDKALCCATCYTGTTTARPTTARPPTVKPPTVKPTNQQPATAEQTTIKLTTDRITTSKQITQQTTSNQNNDQTTTTPTDTNSDAQDSGPNMTVVAGGVAGGVVAVVVAIVILCVIRRKSSKARDRPVFANYDNPGFTSHPAKPHHPPPRRTVGSSHQPPTQTNQQADPNAGMQISSIENSMPALYPPSSPNGYNHPHQNQQRQNQHLTPSAPPKPLKPTNAFVGELESIHHNAASASDKNYSNLHHATPHGNVAKNALNNDAHGYTGLSPAASGNSSVAKQPLKPIVPIKPKHKSTGADNKAFDGDRPVPPKRPVPRRQTSNNDVS